MFIFLKIIFFKENDFATKSNSPSYDYANFERDKAMNYPDNDSILNFFLFD
jgi:hypothetical protein